jgi:hypothetical protein
MVDKRMRNLIYAAIAVVCIVSILLGVFRMFLGEDTNTIGESGGNSIIDTSTQDALREDFSALFNNTVSRLSDESTMGILKQMPEREFIITGYENQMAYSSENDTNIDKEKCFINVHFPNINLQGDYIEKVWNPVLTKEFYQVFMARYSKGVELSVKKSSGIPTEANTVENETNTVGTNTTNNQNMQTVSGIYSYEANFAGTVYQNRYLSLAEMSLDLVPGKNQRRYIRTCNVDITTGEEITINKMLQLKGLNVDEVNAKIQEEIKKINDSAKAYRNAIADRYIRDNELAKEGFYDVNNIQNFMVGPNGELLLIYNYGNEENNYTLAFDIIKIE